MTNVVEIFSRKPVRQTAGVPGASRSKQKQDPWIDAFVGSMDDEQTASDVHFILLNGALIDQARMIASEIEGVVQRTEHHTNPDDAVPIVHAESVPESVRGIVNELTHSSHVLWLSEPDFYMSMVSRFRRRLSLCERACAKVPRKI